MQKIIRAALFAKDAKTSLILAIAVLGFVVLGCSGSGEKSKNLPLTSAYHGSWSTNDGTTLKITSDGIGDYKSGGTSVQGAAAELDETGKILKLSFLGMAVKEFKIDQEPKNGAMKLDGVLYYTDEGRKGATTDNPSDDPAGDPAQGQGAPNMPSDVSRDELVQETMLRFNEAVQSEDFSNFLDEYCSAAYREKFTAADLKKKFTTFINEKDPIDEVFSSISEMDPAYSPAPKIVDSGNVKVLTLSGTFSTFPSPTKFELDYEPEGNTWKVRGVNIKIGK